jgi:hypothetical protein
MSNDNGKIVEERSAPETDRRRKDFLRAERKQLDDFATIAYKSALAVAVADAGVGGLKEGQKIDFDAISKWSYQAARSMMRHRRDFGRDYEVGQ